MIKYNNILPTLSSKLWIPIYSFVTGGLKLPTSSVKYLSLLPTYFVHTGRVQTTSDTVGLRNPAF